MVEGFGGLAARLFRGIAANSFVVLCKGEDAGTLLRVVEG